MWFTCIILIFPQSDEMCVCVCVGGGGVQGGEGRGSVVLRCSISDFSSVACEHGESRLITLKLYHYLC